MNKSLPYLWIATVALATWLPFLHKPLFIDDHAVVIQARALAHRSWAEPYDTRPGTLGWTPGQSVGEDNPPVFFYWLSTVSRYLGEEPWKARASTLPLQLLGLFALYAIAWRSVLHPLWATLLVCVSPHLWVTSNSLLVDSILGPAMWIALWLWMKAWESDTPEWGLAAGLALGVVPLIKYTGLLLWPVAVFWTFFESHRLVSRKWLWWIVPLAVWSGWLLFSRAQYGTDHFTATAASRMVWPQASKAVVLSAFIAATLPAIWGPWLAGVFGAWWRRVLALLTMAGALAWGIQRSDIPWTMGLQLSAWAALFAGVAAGWTGSILKRPYLWLVAWSVLGCAGLGVALDWVCARFLVIIGAPISLLSVAALEEGSPRLAGSAVFRGAVLLLASTAGLMVMHADFSQARVDAEAARWATEWKRTNAPDRQAFYPAASRGGLRAYLPEGEWTPLSPKTPVPAGSILLIPRRTLPAAFLPSAEAVELLDRRDFLTWNPVRVADQITGSGFYGSVWGPLPVSFSKGPLETYALFSVE